MHYILDFIQFLLFSTHVAKNFLSIYSSLTRQTEENMRKLNKAKLVLHNIKKPYAFILSVFFSFIENVGGN